LPIWLFFVFLTCLAFFQNPEKARGNLAFSQRVSLFFKYQKKPDEIWLFSFSWILFRTIIHEIAHKAM